MDDKQTIAAMKLLETWKNINGGLFLIAILAFPAGLISWMFWAHGWKIAVASIVVFMWCFFVHEFIKNIEEELVEKKRRVGG